MNLIQVKTSMRFDCVLPRFFQKLLREPSIVWILPCIVGLTFSLSSQAKTDWAAGIILGAPTGLHLKAAYEKNQAVHMGLGYSFGNSAVLWADHAWNAPQFFGTKESFIQQLSAYLGVGGILFLGGKHEADLGLRVPLGVEWRPRKTPLGVFVELVPGISLFPDVEALIFAGVGVRYYF